MKRVFEAGHTAARRGRVRRRDTEDWFWATLMIVAFGIMVFLTVWPWVRH